MRLGGSHSRSGRFGQEKNISLVPRIETQYLGRQLGSLSCRESGHVGCVTWLRAGRLANRGSNPGRAETSVCHGCRTDCSALSSLLFNPFKGETYVLYKESGHIAQ